MVYGVRVLHKACKMKWLVLVVCMYCVVCHAGIVDNSTSLKSAEPNGEKGFLEWVSSLFGGTTTTSPILDDPSPLEKECPPCQCGIASAKRRIVGGNVTKAHQYTWMAMLLYNGRMFCGGSLISDLYIMTAAHCTGFRKERMTVRLLEHDVSDRGDIKIVERKVDKVIRHPRYNPGTYDNDIAMLRLDKPIDLSAAVKKRASNDEVETTTESEGTTGTDGTTTTTTEKDEPTIRPVCLPPAGLSYTKDCGLVIGWGVTEQGGTVSPVLREVQVPIVSNAECRSRSYGMRVTDNMLCAGEPEGGRDACQGDSGGPLHVFNKTNERYHEVGVVSWGEGCAAPNKYGVYTRVNRYLTWIKSNTRDACYCH